MKTIGERIHQMRKKKNMTLEDVAKLTHTTRQTIQRYEAGIVTNIPYDRIISLAAALEVTPAYLMGWQEDPAPSTAPIWGNLSNRDCPFLLPFLRKCFRGQNEKTNDFSKRVRQKCGNLFLDNKKYPSPAEAGEGSYGGMPP